MPFFDAARQVSDYRRVEIFAGTSGYSYKEWKGSFYPQRLAGGEMLRFYAQHLSAVEINNTFYRSPTLNLLESWAAQVPDDFRFAIKAPRRITHVKRLTDVSGEMKALLTAVEALGARLGVLLFQLPPFLAKDPAKLDSFLALLPRNLPGAFEFRHPSWCDEDIYARLRARNLAACVADTDKAPADGTVSTADWGYLRLRRADYSDADLKAWLTQLRSFEWNKAFVFFKHEDAGTGPRFAARFLELAGGPM